LRINEANIFLEQGSVFTGANANSHGRNAHILTTLNLKYKGGGGPYWHDVHTKCNEYSSVV